MLKLLKTLLVLAAGGDAGVAAADRARLEALAKAMPYENLLRSVSLALESADLAKRCDDHGLVLQMLVLRLAELPRLKRLEEVLAAGAPAGATHAAASAPPFPSGHAQRAPAPASVSGGGSSGGGARILSIVPVEAEPDPPEPAGPRSPVSDAAAIERFHEILDSRRRITSAQASLAEAIQVNGDELVLRFGIDKAAAKEALEEPATRKLLAEVAKEAFGRPLKVMLKTGPPADGDLGQAAREVPREALSRERASNRAETDPVVRSAMELFRAELTEVKEEE